MTATWIFPLNLAFPEKQKVGFHTAISRVHVCDVIIYDFGRSQIWRAEKSLSHNKMRQGLCCLIF